jgi:hypothetical protein
MKTPAVQMRTALALFTSALLASACREKECTLLQEDSSAGLHVEYGHNDSGQVTRRTSYWEGSVDGDCIFEYNNAGLLDRQVDTLTGGYFQYTYANDGTLKTAAAYSTADGVAHAADFYADFEPFGEYGSTTATYWKPGQPYPFAQLYFAQNVGPGAKFTDYRFIDADTGESRGSRIKNYRVDDKPTTGRRFCGDLIFPDVSELTGWIDNNVTSIKTSIDDPDEPPYSLPAEYYVYEYNEDGYPTRRSGGTFNVAIDFTYHCE